MHCLELGEGSFKIARLVLQERVQFEFLPLVYQEANPPSAQVLVRDGIRAIYSDGKHFWYFETIFDILLNARENMM